MTKNITSKSINVGNHGWNLQQLQHLLNKICAHINGSHSRCNLRTIIWPGVLWHALGWIVIRSRPILTVSCDTASGIISLASAARGCCCWSLGLSLILAEWTPHCLCRLLVSWRVVCGASDGWLKEDEKSRILMTYKLVQVEETTAVETLQCYLCSTVHSSYQWCTDQTLWSWADHWNLTNALDRTHIFYCRQYFWFKELHIGCWLALLVS